MASSLSNKLRGILDKVRSKGRLSEKDIDEAMQEIRIALLEADVNYKVVKNFVLKTREKCLTSEVLDSLTPGQNVVKIVLEQLTELLGSDDTKMILPQKTPNTIMLVGLQGSGKTTAAAKLAYYFKQRGRMPLLVACDVYRPAAAEQLQTLGDEIDVKVYRGDGQHPVQIARQSLKEAKETLRDVVIIDTAGRLHVDEEMMEEAKAIKDAVDPDQVLMVVDAMTGQDATNVVAAFAEKVDFDGVIMSKMDGDARGGAALSVREVTGKPIKFVSDGEKPDSLQEFHPDRMAKRILGMGDMVTLIEQAQMAADKEIEEEEAERLARADLTLDDFILMNKQLHKMGGASKFIQALPGGEKALDSGQVQMDFFDRAEVIVNSMTKEERRKPAVLNGSRRARIAKGAGVQVSEVNQVIAKFNETRKVLKKMYAMTGQKPTKKRPTKGGKGSRKAKRRAEKRGRGGMGTVPGMGGNLSMRDLKKLQDMFDETQGK
ncbi:MAG: signal recognition particle protein [Coriobacteriales bacterium]|jgi:signal recognition particle subunit SRP54